jgi:uncharacterized protein YecE (DUF72 family)
LHATRVVALRRVRPRIGCSGWNYKAWRGSFYPHTLPVRQWLEYYAARFDTVEVNNTFYRLPERSTFTQWATQVPAGFLMAVKASRYLTHMKRLRDPEEPLTRLLSRATGLGRHLGPMLFQLPGHFTRDLDRLDAFLQQLPREWKSRRLHHVMEFRDPSWYVDEVFAILRRRRVALCLHDKAGSTIDGPFVGPVVYVRFHGTSGHYQGSYSGEDLDRWARRLAEQVQDGRRVYAYFNNDPGAAAVENATTLREQLEALLRQA